MKTAWLVRVSECGKKAPPACKHGSVSLHVTCNLGFVPPQKTATLPHVLVMREWEVVVPLAELREDGHGFFTRLLCDLPSSANPQNLDKHALAESVLRVATAMTKPGTVRVSLGCSTKMGKAEIERVMINATAARMRCVTTCKDARRKRRRMRVWICACGF